MTKKEFEDLVPGTLVIGERHCRAVYLGRAIDLLSGISDLHDYRVFRYVDPPLSKSAYWNDLEGNSRPGWLIYEWESRFYDMSKLLEVLCVP